MIFNISSNCNHEVTLRDLREFINYQIIIKKNIIIPCPY